MSANGVDKDVIGTVTRADGTKQVTIGGWPIYRFAGDTAPGRANGHGIGGTWFGVNSEGGKAGADQPKTKRDVAQGEVPEDVAQSGTKVLATKLDGIGPALVDQDGHTLYLFQNDSTDPPQTACEGTCAQQWPPLLDRGELEIRGVDEELVGTTIRPDGDAQVTIGGWPVYRFANDTAPGQVNGHGVDGTWFVIEPAGCKSDAPVPSRSGNAGQSQNKAGEADEPTTGYGY